MACFVMTLDQQARDGQSRRPSLEQQLFALVASRVHPVASQLLANGSLTLLLASGAQDQDRARLPNRPYRAYVNNFRRGDHPAAHRDAPLGSRHLTALVYANSVWKRDWGGETMFYDEVCACGAKGGETMRCASE
jgi:hypothetical protein